MFGIKLSELRERATDRLDELRERSQSQQRDRGRKDRRLGELADVDASPKNTARRIARETGRQQDQLAGVGGQSARASAIDASPGDVGTAIGEATDGPPFGRAGFSTRRGLREIDASPSDVGERVGERGPGAARRDGDRVDASPSDPGQVLGAPDGTPSVLDRARGVDEDDFDPDIGGYRGDDGLIVHGEAPSDYDGGEDRFRREDGAFKDGAADLGEGTAFDDDFGSR